MASCEIERNRTKPKCHPDGEDSHYRKYSQNIIFCEFSFWAYYSENCSSAVAIILFVRGFIRITIQRRGDHVLRLAGKNVLGPSWAVVHLCAANGQGDPHIASATKKPPNSNAEHPTILYAFLTIFNNFSPIVFLSFALYHFASAQNYHFLLRTFPPKRPFLRKKKISRLLSILTWFVGFFSPTSFLSANGIGLSNVV